MQIVINIDNDGSAGMTTVPEPASFSVPSADGEFNGGSAPVEVEEETPAEATAGIETLAAGAASFDGGESRYTTGR